MLTDLDYSTTRDSVTPCVTVLMATFNGARFLDEQLQSLDRQTVGLVNLIVSDDGSSDGTLGILENWQSRWCKGSFSITNGPQRGFAENFRRLALLPGIDTDYIAFCDQDDIWDADKLSAAIAILSSGMFDHPTLYLSRTRLVDTEGRPIGSSRLFRRPPSFANALVQSIGGANTVVMNQAGFSLFAASIARTGFISHDWWSYLVISGAGGSVRYDPIPHISYRQHDTNAVGRNTGLVAALHRLRFLARSGFADWMSANIAGLDLCRDLLTDDACNALDRLKALRSMTPLPALVNFARSGFHRQTLLGTIGLGVAVALGRL